MTGPAVASIDTAALRHNLSYIRSLAPSSKCLAVIKAHAYGHGLLTAARELDAADAYAVAHIEEAIVLREAGCTKSVLLLQGFLDARELKTCASHDLWSVVHHPEQIDLLEQTPLEKPIHAWLKIDTGMHRLGIGPSEAQRSFERLKKCRNVEEIVAMSHFACADELEHPANAVQLNCFNEVTASWGVARTMANSAAILTNPNSHFEWIRPGISLYGASPLLGQSAKQLGLKPVMHLDSQLIAVNAIKKGEFSGYGATWTAPRDTLLGVVGVGYGDGYPRHAGNGAPVSVNGRLVNTVGRVSMDMICVDLGPDAKEQVGDPVELWGDTVPLNDVANHAGTIPYELTCRLTTRIQFEQYDG